MTTSACRCGRHPAGLRRIGDSSDYQPTSADIAEARATARDFRAFANRHAGTPEAETALGAACVSDATADRMEQTRAATSRD